MAIKEWGNATWCVFHTLACKLKNIEKNHAKELLSIFIDICHNLPCPICRNHAIKVLKKANTRIVTNKADLIIFMWQFHNLVNKKLGKHKFTFEEHTNKYKNINTNDVVNTYFFVMTKKKKRNMGNILENSMIMSSVKKFRKYFNENKHLFND